MSSSETPFKWHYAGGQILARSRMLIGKPSRYMYLDVELNESLTTPVWLLPKRINEREGRKEKDREMGG